jgi:hypothetical protein
MDDMRITMRRPAGPHTVFGPAAFDSQIGREIPVRVGEQSADEAQTGTIVAAKVAPDGTWVDLTVEVPDNVAAIVGRQRLGDFSIGFRP